MYIYIYARVYVPYVKRNFVVHGTSPEGNYVLRARAFNNIGYVAAVVVNRKCLVA